MTICCISDTHGHKPHNLPPADILIHAGDFTASRVHHKDESTEFLDWFYQQPYKHKLLVAGNHDFYPYYNKNFHKLCSAYGIHYLQDSSVTINDIKFYGTPWTPPFYNWAFMKPEHELEDTFAQIPLDTDVLITHGPASGMLDYTPHGGNVGSTALADAIKPLNLKAHIFGHIHHSHGVYTETGTQYVNAAIITESYKPIQIPRLLTIEDIYITQPEFY